MARVCAPQAQPMIPLIAASVLQAVQALVADAVQIGKPPEASWHMLHTVNISACHSLLNPQNTVVHKWLICLFESSACD